MIELSVQDWISLTTAGLASLSPLYILVWKMTNKLSDLNEHLAVLSSIISRCPYCNRVDTYEVENDNFKFRRE